MQLGSKIQRDQVTVPEAYHKAFAEEISRGNTLEAVSLPSPTTVWLQQIANIQFKLEHDQMSPDKRRNLEHELSILRRKLDQN